MLVAFAVIFNISKLFLRFGSSFLSEQLRWGFRISNVLVSLSVLRDLQPFFGTILINIGLYI